MMPACIGSDLKEKIRQDLRQGPGGKNIKLLWDKFISPHVDDPVSDTGVAHKVVGC